MFLLALPEALSICILSLKSDRPISSTGSRMFSQV